MKLLVGNSKMGSLGALVLTACVFWLTGCSRGVLFIVTNRSGGSIEVRYKMKLSPSGSLVECDTPGVKPISQLEANQPFRQLADSEYKLDRANRVVVVSLKPQETLRITVTRYLENDDDERMMASRFCVEEIEVTGDRGKSQFQGDQAYFAFNEQHSGIRSLTYK